MPGKPTLTDGSLSESAERVERKGPPGSRHGRSRRLVATAVVVILATASLCGIGLFGVYSYGRCLAVGRRHCRVIELSGQAGQLDQMLAHSVLEAATKADSVCVQRYGQLQSQLEAVIDELAAMTDDPQAGLAVNEIDVARRDLDAIAGEAFQLAAAGKGDLAMELVRGPEYGTRQSIYSDAINGLVTVASDYAEQQARAEQARVWASFGIVTTVVAMLPFGVLGAFWRRADATRRRKGRTMLRRHKRLLRDVMEAVSHRLVVVNADDYSVEMANSRARAAEAVGAGLSPGGHQSGLSCEDQTCPICTVKATKKAVAVEREYEDRHGDLRYAEIHGYPVLDDKGEVCRVIEYEVDITRLKQAQTAAQEQTALLDAVFEAAPLGILLMNRELTVRKANSTASTLLGDGEGGEMALSCVLNDRNLRQCGLGPQCVRCRLREAIENAFKTGQPTEGAHIEHIVDDDDQLAGSLEVSIRRIRTSDEDQVIIVLGDAAAGAGDSGTRSRFLAEMSHEIRTPMNAIIGFGDILADEPLADEQIEYVNSIRYSTRHLLQIVDDILELSRIEAGTLRVEPVDCRLSHILSSIESLVAPKAAAENLKFSLDVDDDNLPQYIHTDPTHLKQCVTNLISCAIGFTHRSRVRMSVSTAGDGDPSVIFRISDDSISIAAEDIQKVFEPFTAIRENTVRTYGSTGLALPIARHLARLLGGDITLTSEGQNGVTFALTTPVGQVACAQSDQTDGLQRRRRTGAEGGQSDSMLSGKVLIAEDIPTNQILVTALLNRLGIETRIAQDGVEAVEMARSEDFDLIFMDMQMPRMSGYEATQTLRREGLETPIVALTAYAMAGDEEKCLDAGCNDYVTKPIDRQRLRQVLGKHLAGDKSQTVGARASAEQ